MMIQIQFLLVVALKNILLPTQEKASHECTFDLQTAAPHAVANIKQNFGRIFIALKQNQNKTGKSSCKNFKWTIENQTNTSENL